MAEAPHAAGGRRIWAVVPYKGPIGSKRRLASLLDEDERARLSLAMLDDGLEALLGEPRIEQVLLLAPGERGHSFAALGPGSGRPDAVPSTGGRDGRAPTARPGADRLSLVSERLDAASLSGGDTLNAAIRQAQAVAAAASADALLVVPGDLPTVSSLDIAALLDASGADASAVTIAPDRIDEGTNALLLAPPTAIAPSFGVGSFARHAELARQAGLAQAVVRRPGLTLDLDTPADVALLLAGGQDCRAARLLRELGIEERLGRLLAAQARSTTI
jgi:2-phospho-L-lactate guanylyltransferase